MQNYRNFAVNQTVANMKVITIESEAYKKLMQKIDQIYSYVENQAKKNVVPKPKPSEIWIENEEAAKMLAISLRTLQRLRSKGEVTYSIRGGRVRYTLQEVNRLITGRVVRNNKTKGGKP